ncbi:hypothetical protein MIZ03_2082 [Rhodoferax lithotrophicus]|uniref:Cytochrome c domain-containing protein n=1 Tax=Rhodoferax lithotrophicus TaxID=2798804 RepID=A0ABM7MLW8_9BURK|nr:class I cytochrome c [Rhodoferax sp. MIZ03]BCO27194.1 hypothetical protein MIZ03_2082 [Rhodoferax sp. MIZ03]
MKTFCRFFSGLALASLSTWASADALQVRSMAASCAACHGTHGLAQKGMESLRGKTKDELFSKMQDFKSGKKPATLMHQIAKGYTDVQIEQLASYYSSLKN